MDPSTKSDRSARPDPDTRSAADESNRGQPVNTSGISDNDTGWMRWTASTLYNVGTSYLFGKHDDPLRGVVSPASNGRRPSRIPDDLFGEVKSHVSMDPPEEGSPHNTSRRVGGGSVGTRSVGPPIDEVFADLEQEARFKQEQRRLKKQRQKLEKLKKKTAAAEKASTRHASNNGGVPFEAEASTIPINSPDGADGTHHPHQSSSRRSIDPEAAAVNPPDVTVPFDDQRIGLLIDQLAQGLVSGDDVKAEILNLSGPSRRTAAEMDALATSMAVHESKNGVYDPRRHAIDPDEEKVARRVQGQILRDPAASPAALPNAPRRKRSEVVAKKALATLLGREGGARDGDSSADEDSDRSDSAADVDSDGSSDDETNGWSGSYEKSFVASEDEETCDSDGFTPVVSRKKSKGGKGASNHRTPSMKKLKQAARRRGEKVSSSKPADSCQDGCTCGAPLKKDLFLPSESSTIPTYSSGTAPTESSASESAESEETEGEYTENSDRFDLRNADILPTATPNVSFLSLEASKLKEMVADIVPSLELPTAEVEIPALQRLEPTDKEYQNQRDKLVAQGYYKPKKEELLTPFAHDLSIEKSKGSLSAEKKEDVVSHFNQNTERIKEVERHCVNFDLKNDVCYVFEPLPGVDLNMSTDELRSTRLDELIDLSDKEKCHYIWTKWASLSYEHVAFMQRLLNYHPQMRITVKDSNHILYRYLRNMLRPELRTTVDRTYEKAFSEEKGQRGGLTYAFAILRKVNCGTATTRSILDAHRKKVCDTGPSFFNNGENMSYIQEYFNTIILDPLTAMDHFGPSDVDFYRDLLKFLVRSSCPAFSKYFDEQLQAHTRSKVTEGGILTFSSRDRRTSIEKSDEMKGLLGDALGYYDLLVHEGDYTNDKQKSLSSYSVSPRYEAAGCKCFNCDEPGHSVKDCKKQKDDARIARNKKAYDDAKAAKRNESGVPSRGPRSGNGGGGGGGDKSNQQKTHKTMQHDGKTCVAFKCNKCGGDNGRWTNHSTKHHDKALKDASFCMSKAAPGHPGCEMMKEKKLKSLPLAKDKQKATATSPKSDDAREAWNQYQTDHADITAQMEMMDKDSPEYAEAAKELSVLTSNFGKLFR